VPHARISTLSIVGEGRRGGVAEEIGADAADLLDRVADRAGLLEDLLLHVVPVRAQLDRAGVRLHDAGFALDLRAGAVVDGDAFAGHVGDVALFEIDDAVGRAGERHRVGREEVLAVAEPGHERRPEAGADHAMRFGFREHRDRVRAVEARDGLLHGGEQVALVQMVHEVRDHLGVGLAREHVAGRLEFGAQFLVVLDDAVVDDGDLVAREVRMRVVRARRAVRGPARVRDAGQAVEVVGLDLGREVRDAGRAARAFEAVAIHGDAAGVIATIFQPPQPFHEDGDDVAAGDCTDDSTHDSVTDSKRSAGGCVSHPHERVTARATSSRPSPDASSRKS
jgi:hypothetical protein